MVAHVQRRPVLMRVEPWAGRGIQLVSLLQSFIQWPDSYACSQVLDMF